MNFPNFPKIFSPVLRVEKIKNQTVVISAVWFILIFSYVLGIPITNKDYEGKFGVDSRLFKIYEAPNFSSEKLSSVKEEELLGLFWPTLSFVVTDTFNSVRRSGRRHYGLDIRARDSSGNFQLAEVFACDKGTVCQVGRDPLYGNFITISHEGFFSRYAHLSKILVKKGQEVERGRVMGICGSTGRSSGPHLHFEIFVREGNKRIRLNPLQFFPDFKVSYALPKRGVVKRGKEISIEDKEDPVAVIFETYGSEKRVADVSRRMF